MTQNTKIIHIFKGFQCNNCIHTFIISFNIISLRASINPICKLLNSVRKLIILEFIVMMQVDSSIAEEQHIRGYEPEPEAPARRSKYATMKEIKAFQRLTETYNQRLNETHPSLFLPDPAINAKSLHLVCTQNEQYFLDSEDQQTTQDAVVKSEGVWTVRVPLSNIQQRSVLTVELGRMKAGRTFAVENRRIRNGKVVRYRFTVVLMESSLILRVWLQLDGNFKVWKEMEVPSPQSKVCLEVSEYNHQQTDVKLNDYLFHLVLKMPYEEESHYSLLYDDTRQIQRVELRIEAEGRTGDEMETNCSKECQLI